MRGIFAIILCLCLMASGCGGNQEDQQAAVQNADEKWEDDGGVKIGLSFDSFVIERWIRDRDVFVSTAKELGATVNVQNANGSVKEQISQIQYLIGRDVDVLVVIATDCGALSEVMKRAKEEGIVTMSYDRLIQDADTDLYVSFNNEAVGTLMAQALKESIPEGGQIFMLQGAKEDNNVSLVKKGFEEEIQGSGLEVVYQANCQGWVAELAAEYLDEALEEYPEVKGIMCGNDDIASQVVRVLTEHRMAGRVQVVGQDGDLAACQRIVEGTQTMTAFKPVELLAKAAAKYAVSMARGEELDRINSSIHDGSQKIPFLMLQPISVTSRNMDEIIVDGGYHSREEVYLNVTKK
ncbi:MAG: substrate-binding domain-containing protein [Eubacteriales bacterium]|nr:substrate-binding domain-containing protein [Eubacteriales bacterium]